jgi:hypothetical protein
MPTVFGGQRKVVSDTRFDKVLRSSRYENSPPALFIQKQDQLDFIVMSDFLDVQEACCGWGWRRAITKCPMFLFKLDRREYASHRYSE